MTLRALDVLGSADVIAAEDTRVTRGAAARTTASRRARCRCTSTTRHARGRAHRRAPGARAAASRWSATPARPAVSDPGARLVRAVRDAGFPVVPIPGANAAIAAVSAAGLAAERFLFLGFLPATAKARRELLAAVAALPWRSCLRGAASRRARRSPSWPTLLGGERELVVARELTKKFETIARMPLAEAAAWLAADANRERGEFVLLVDAAAAAEVAPARRRSRRTPSAGCARSSTSCRRRARRGSSPP